MFELMATLLGSICFDIRGPAARGGGIASFSAAADNQSNLALAPKGLAAKPPLAAGWAEVALQATTCTVSVTISFGHGQGHQQTGSYNRFANSTNFT